MFRLLSNRDPTEKEQELAREAVDDWKAEIAMKRPCMSDKYAPEGLRMRFIKMIDEAAKEKASVVTEARGKNAELAAEWKPTIENLEDLSCILQPLMVSPMINFGDILSAMKQCIDAHPAWHEKVVAAEKAGNEAEVLKLTDMILLEVIRVLH